MIVIADNDIIHKLALCNLLDELLIWLEVPPSEIWVLPSLKFIIGKKLKNNPAAYSYFEEFLKSTVDVPIATPDILDFFNSLDVGEQHLLALFVEQQETSRLVTGDKRALKQLSVLAQQNPLLNSKLVGQVDCLEGILLGLIETCGFDKINCKILPEADGVFRLAFGEGRSEVHVIEALQSYLRDLRQTSAFVIER